MRGIGGASVAGVPFFLPASLLLSMAAVYLNFGDVPPVQGIFYGIKPVVVAVVLFAAWRIVSKAIMNRLLGGNRREVSQHEMDPAWTPEDRPHRPPVADRPLHR